MAAKLFSRVWVDPDIKTQSQKIVLLCLADYANQENRAWPSIASICKRTCLSERSVHYAIGSLKNSGKINVENNKGQHLTNVYTLYPMGATNAPRNDCTGAIDDAKGCNDCSEGGANGVSSIAPNPAVPRIDPAITPHNGNGKTEWKPNPIQQRLNSLFNRRDNTRWDDKKEVPVFKRLESEILEEDLQMIERYYLDEKIPSDRDYRRRDLATLLNNWNGEVDRARKYDKRQVAVNSVI